MNRISFVVALSAFLLSSMFAGEAAPEAPKFWKDIPERADVLAATFLGGKGNEWLVSGGFQPDGTVVVVGNVIGPVLELSKPAMVIGTDLPAPGENILATLKLGVYLMRQADYISDHEVKIGNKVAEVLCGGNVSPGTPVSEQYILDLEREAFKSLCGERKTQERIQYTLKTGKTLRN